MMFKQKGGGVKGLLNNELHFSYTMASLIWRAEKLNLSANFSISVYCTSESILKKDKGRFRPIFIQ